MRKICTTVAAATLLAVGAAASAQPAGYTGPSSTGKPAAYSGPSSVPLMTVKQLLDTGADDQYARLQGRIVSHDGGDRYTFEDDSGRISVEIDEDDFPQGQPIGAQTRVEVLGEFDKGRRGSELEVDKITLLP